ncbi:MAG: hypothetical protein JWN84_1186 [Nocardioides sp.]|jgi:hypothetical protein|nr:hypothetical protein [Nocardioides sp.]
MDTLTAPAVPAPAGAPRSVRPLAPAVVRGLAALHALVALLALGWSAWVVVEWLPVRHEDGLIDLTWFFVSLTVAPAVALLVASAVATFARRPTVSSGAGLLAGTVGALIGVPSCLEWLVRWEDPEPVSLLLLPAAVLPLVLVVLSVVCLVRLGRGAGAPSAPLVAVRLHLGLVGLVGLALMALGGCVLAESLLAPDEFSSTGWGLTVAGAGAVLVLVAALVLAVDRPSFVHGAGLVVATLLAVGVLGAWVAEDRYGWYLVGLVLPLSLGAAAGSGLAARARLGRASRPL